MTPYRTEDYHWHLPGWPGSYDSEESATFARQFGHELLERLQASVNPGGVIGLGMLQRAWDGDIPETWVQQEARRKAEAQERRRCENPRCRKITRGTCNLNGVRLCGPCASRRLATQPSPCIYPECGVLSLGGRCRRHRDYEAPLPEKDRRALLTKREMPKLTDVQEQSVDRLLGRVLGVR